MRKGKYIKVWVYEENLPAIESMDNIGRTINNYIAANNSINTQSITTSALGSVRAVYSVPTSSSALVCPNGHLKINGDKCISSACKYSKPQKNVLNIGNVTPDKTQCLHKSCIGCQTGSCSGVHMISCPCPDCSVVL